MASTKPSGIALTAAQNLQHLSTNARLRRPAKPRAQGAMPGAAGSKTFQEAPTEGRVGAPQPPAARKR